MKLYILLNGKGRLYMDKAFLYKETAMKFHYNYAVFEGRDDVEITEIEVDSDFIGRHIYVIDAYYGFDYGDTSMYDVVSLSEDFYATKEAAMTDSLYQRILKRAEAFPKEFRFTKDAIYSLDCGNREWFYGDVMENKVNMKIKKLRVYKKGVE